MKLFRWNVEKDLLLKESRDIGFEAVVFFLERGEILDDLEHPNPRKYPNQRIFVLDIGGYVHLVPYVESDTEIFLKTIIPSRKATRHYRDPGAKP